MLFPNLNYVQYRVAYGDMVVSNWLACEVFKYIYINNIWVMKKKEKKYPIPHAWLRSAAYQDPLVEA